MMSSKIAKWVAFAVATLLASAAAIAGTFGGGGGGIAASLVCRLTGGADCMFTGAPTLAVGVCPTMTAIFGAAGTTGVCDNGGGQRPVIRVNGVSVAEASPTVSGIRMLGSFGVTVQGHYVSTTTAATISGSSTCTSTSIAGTGRDVKGTITATCTAGQTVILTQAVTGNAAQTCLITPANAAAAAVALPYQSAGTTSSVTWTFPAVTAGSWNYVCIE